MTDPEARAPIRRILVALDASGASLAALEAAARLAATLEADLLGLFVEDIDLLRFAELPFAREVGLTFAQVRRMESADMERALRAQAARARQALERVASRTSVQCTFRVVRGRVTEELLGAATDVDIVAIGFTSHAIPRARPGTTATALATGAGRTILILPSETAIRPPVMAVYDGSPAARHALTLAVRLAQAEPWPLLLWIAGPNAPRRRALQQEVEQSLEGAGLTATVRDWEDHDLSLLLREVRRHRGGTLVLPADMAHGERERLTQVLEQAGGAVLLVR